MDEPLNEKAFGEGLVVRGIHWFLMGPRYQVAAEERDLIQKITMSEWLFFTPANGFNFETWSQKYKMEVRDNLFAPQVVIIFYITTLFICKYFIFSYKHSGTFGSLNLNR